MTWGKKISPSLLLISHLQNGIIRDLPPKLVLMIKGDNGLKALRWYLTQSKHFDIVRCRYYYRDCKGTRQCFLGLLLGSGKLTLMYSVVHSTNIHQGLAECQTQAGVALALQRLRWESRKLAGKPSLAGSSPLSVEARRGRVQEGRRQVGFKEIL